MNPGIYWPDDFPSALLSERGTRAASPITRTQFASGRARMRRDFTAVPVLHSVSFVLNTEQAKRFEAWFRNRLQDGTEWFWMPIALPQGDGPWTVRYTDIYSGPTPLGPRTGRLWKYTAEVEQWLRAVDDE